MSNRFDEIVDEAVNEVGDRQPDATANPAKAKMENVVSLDQPAERPRQRSKPKSKREQSSYDHSDPAAALARGLTRPLVTKTVRFRPELAEALNRVVLENKLAGKKPDTIQDLVNEATEAWVSTRR